ncbi:MAG: glycosyltransferase family 2 protein, partial [Bacteroides sp.]|nr:glycosyltransferase family 2 protein [Bacteroides sp.]
HASPNYLLVLQMAQKKALEDDSYLCIVESDVIIQPDTLQSLYDEALKRSNYALMAAVTVDEEGNVNYPYVYAKKYSGSVTEMKKHLSFCCTILSHRLLRTFDFKQLDPAKSWHDVTISHKSLKLGFSNYLCMHIKVFHKPHSSRPWKLLKYTHPFRYYFLKILHKRDKI